MAATRKRKPPSGLQVRVLALMIKMARKIGRPRKGEPDLEPKLALLVSEACQDLHPQRFKFYVVHGTVLRCTLPSGEDMGTLVFTPSVQTDRKPIHRIGVYMQTTDRSWDVSPGRPVVKLSNDAFPPEFPSGAVGSPRSYDPSYLESRMDLLDASPDLELTLVRSCVTKAMTKYNHGKSFWLPCKAWDLRGARVPLEGLAKDLASLGVEATPRWISYTPAMKVLQVDRPGHDSLRVCFIPKTLTVDHDVIAALSSLCGPAYRVHLVANKPPRFDDGCAATDLPCPFHFHQPTMLPDGDPMYSFNMLTLKGYLGRREGRGLKMGSPLLDLEGPPDSAISFLDGSGDFLL